MTRLTTQIRNRIVSAVLADTPDTIAEDATKLQAEIEEWAWSQLPAPCPEPLRPYIQISNLYMDDGKMYVHVPYNRAFDWAEQRARIRAEFGDRLKDIGTRYDARSALRDKLVASLAGCHTAKQLKERFPELAVYLPEPDTAAQLPATTDLMDSLRAAGWPEGRAQSNDG